MNEVPNYGINYNLVKGCKLLLMNGEVRVNARTGDEIKELHDYVIFGNPEMRYLTLAERKNNICAQAVEMMMVLSGNPDLKYLSPFLPRADQYSDDGGKTWRGNYGIRLRGNKAFKGENNDSFQFARYTRDNLAKVIETLQNDNSSRQCFITIGDSNLDRFIETKDTPCTMTLVFGITPSFLLRLSVFMRSNDVIFGFSGANYFIFTCLQELVGCILGYKLGPYCHHAVSFHVYSWKYDLLNKLANNHACDAVNEIKLNGGLFNGISSLKTFDEIAEYYFANLFNKDITLDEFYRTIYNMSHNDNLATLLAATYAYYHRLSKDEFKSVCSPTEIYMTGLFDRDSFFNKNVI